MPRSSNITSSDGRRPTSFLANEMVLAFLPRIELKVVNEKGVRYANVYWLRQLVLLYIVLNFHDIIKE